MLTVRPAQMNVLKQVALHSFEDEMVKKLYGFAPNHCAGIGECALRNVIRLGVKRAAGYGFTYRGPVRFYLQLMFMFGSYFDTDPQLLLWSGRLLREGSVIDQMVRAERLHAEVQDYLHKVAGPDNAYALKAVENFRLIAAQPLPYSTTELQSGVLRQMEQIYPERVAYVGRDALTALTAEGFGLARKQMLTTDRGTALCCLLMFELGHGCFEDLLYPWISRTLTEMSSEDPDQRAHRLEARTRAYMKLIMNRIGRR